MTDILIFDFGGQYVFNIKRNFLEMGVSAEIVPFNTNFEKIKNFNPKGIVFSGGPYSPNEKNSPRVDQKILESGIPILGLCYGHQLIAYQLGGKVAKGEVGEYGFSEVKIDDKEVIFDGLGKTEICWMSHRDKVLEAPKNFVTVASTLECKIAAFKSDNRLFGLQFHPEVSHTLNGRKILENFAFKICKCDRGGWDVKKFIEKSVSGMREIIGNEKAVIAVSGGVDSTTLAVLANIALEKNLICVHVDTGLMRKDESKNVCNNLRELGLNVVSVDAGKKFLKELESISISDEKRKIIGKLFIEEFENIAKKENVEWLIQGTIAPDVIESTRGVAKKKRKSEHGGLIKVHHNVAGLPSGMKLKLIEPLSSLFKYQVRILAKELKLPQEFSERQPFPGPGIGCRIAGRVNAESVNLTRDAIDIVEKELKPFKPSQYFAALVENKIIREDTEISKIVSKYLNDDRVKSFVLENDSIGVKGDERFVGKIAVLNLSLKSNDLDKIRWIDFLKMQNEITGKIRDVCRVVVSLNKNFERDSGFGIITRAVNSMDFMTATPTMVPFSKLESIENEIGKISPLIKFVGYEITTKPAATVELI